MDLVCNGTTLNIASWQNALNLRHWVPPSTRSCCASISSSCWCGTAQVWYSVDRGMHVRECRVRCLSCRVLTARDGLVLPAGSRAVLPGLRDDLRVCLDPHALGSRRTGQRLVGPWDVGSPSDAFTTFHPGIFAGCGALSACADGRAKKQRRRRRVAAAERKERDAAAAAGVQVVTARARVGG